MPLRAVRSERTSDERIALWIPIRAWPVISLSIIQPQKQQIMWTILHESFTEAVEAALDNIEIAITSLGPTKNTAVERTESETETNLSLEYGVVPAGMKQAYPRHARAAPLERGEQYVVTIRQTLNRGADHYMVEGP